MIKDRLGANPVPVVLPVGAGDTFNGALVQSLDAGNGLIDSIK